MPSDRGDDLSKEPTTVFYVPTGEERDVLAPEFVPIYQPAQGHFEYRVSRDDGYSTHWLLVDEKEARAIHGRHAALEDVEIAWLDWRWVSEPERLDAL